MNRGHATLYSRLPVLSHVLARSKFPVYSMSFSFEKVCFVIRFFNTEDVCPKEIHCQIMAVYDKWVFDESHVRQWVQNLMQREQIHAMNNIQLAHLAYHKCVNFYNKLD